LLEYGKLKFIYIYLGNIVRKLKQNQNKIDEFNKGVNEISTNENTVNLDIMQEFIPKKSSLKNICIFILKWLSIILVCVLVVIILLIVIALTTSSIWGTILLAIYTSFFYAAVFLVGVKFVFFLLGLGLHKLWKIDKSITQRVLINDTIQFAMLGLLLYLSAFSFPLQVINLVIIPYKWDIVFNNLISIILPMIFFSLIIVNLYAVGLRMKNHLIKNKNKQKVLRLYQLLFIFIASCFFGILYITDIDLSFMSEVERIMFLNTLEVEK